MIKKNSTVKYNKVLSSFARLSGAILLSTFAVSLRSGTLPIPGQPPSGQFPQVSEAEVQSLYNYLQNLDDKELEELERASKQMLTEMGFDPETLQPLSKQPQQKPLAQKSVSQEPEERADHRPEKATKEPEIITATLKEAPIAIDLLVKHLTSLRQKALASRAVEQRIKSWLQDINELIKYAKIINKKVHHTRLALPEFAELSKRLMRLGELLSAYEPLVLSFKKTMDSPYTTLNISPQASQEEIEKVYQLKKQHGPAAVKKHLEKAKLSPTQKAEALRQAELNFSFITEAYDQLKDPISRAILDKELEALGETQKTTQHSVTQALDIIVKGLSDALYHDQLLSKLGQFLKKYEPEELEQRQKLEKAERESKKELEEYMKREPHGKTIRIKPRGEGFGHEYGPSWFGGGGYGGPTYDRGSYGGYTGGAAPFFPATAGQAKQHGRNLPTRPGQQQPTTKDSDEKHPLSPGRTSKSETPLGHYRQSPQKAGTTEQSVYQTLSDLDRQFFAFNTKFDEYKESFDLANAGRFNTNVLEKIADFSRVHMDTLEHIANDLKYTQKLIKPADEQKKKHYQDLWKKSESKDDFTKNVELAKNVVEKVQPVLRGLAEKKGMEETEPSQRAALSQLDHAKKTLDDIATSLKDLNTSIKSSPTGVRSKSRRIAR